MPPIFSPSIVTYCWRSCFRRYDSNAGANSKTEMFLVTTDQTPPKKVSQRSFPDRSMHSVTFSRINWSRLQGARRALTVCPGKGPLLAESGTIGMQQHRSEPWHQLAAKENQTAPVAPFHSFCHSLLHSFSGKARSMLVSWSSVCFMSEHSMFYPHQE